MDSKLVIAYLGNSRDSNSELIEFIHRTFKKSHVQFIYTAFPDYAWCKRLGDQLKAELQEAEGYYTSTNRYTLLSLSDPEHAAEHITCSDLILAPCNEEQATEDSMDELAITPGKRPPSLYLPRKFDGEIRHLVFLSINNAGFKGIQKFCYLFPEMVHSFPVTLLNMFKEKMPANDSGSRAKFNYLRSKCKHLAVHKIVGPIDKKDALALDWGPGTCVIFNGDNNSIESKSLLSVLGINELTHFKSYG